MDPEFSDLVPLFVGEARGRVERLAALAARVETDATALAEARRELHTLKGAGRMLRLAPLSDVCHAAEGVMQSPAPGLGALLTRVVDFLSGLVETVGSGREPDGDPALIAALGGTPEPAPPHPTVPGASLPAATRGELRLDAERMDSLAERATRLRILALAGSSFPPRLLELVRLAEQAMHEPQPTQALAVIAASLRKLALELDNGQRQLHRTAEDQLDALLALQLQPLKTLFHSLSRHARELARSLGREVDVITTGDDTRLDRRIVRALEEALLHLVRNAVDHGIERPEARQAAGKPRAGTLRLEAATVGARVRLVIADDGAGIDPEAVVEAALAAGLTDETAARTLSRDEVLRLLFSPGFSTRSEVSEISGRGIGLDAVGAAVSRVNGSVILASTAGTGTTITLEMPAAMRGEVVSVLRAGRLRLALPAAVIRRVRRLDQGSIVERDGRQLANLGDRLVPFLPLAETFGETPAARQLLLEGEIGGQRIALAVDALEGEQEVLVRPAPGLVAVDPLVEGIALLASGDPVAILAPLAIGHPTSGRAATRTRRAAAATRLRVLLVDDSLVTREMERRLLEDAGFEVVTAADAADALAHLSEESFECVVTDIEMPGMDGLELTRRMRAAPHLAQLPVVVVSTRDRPEDRLKGLEAGADAYLTKQGLDATELVQLVRRLGGR